MALPEIIKDIEARVKDTGDIMTGKLTILTNNKTVAFGCDNSQWAHYYTDATNGHWFNTNLYVKGNIYAGTNYSDLVLTAENFNNYTPTLTGIGASGTWNINAATATKLATERTIALNTGAIGSATSFDGSSNISIPVISLKEDCLNWGERSFAGHNVTGQLLGSSLKGNRLAFIPASTILVEHSIDSGSSWTTTSMTDASKVNFFNGLGSSVVIGGAAQGNVNKSNHQVRLTFTNDGSVYTQLHKFLILVTTNGSSGCWCRIEGRTNKNYNNNVNTWTILCEKTSISGWSGWNTLSTDFVTSASHDEYIRQIRFIFGVTSHAASSYGGLTILKIEGFGGVGWTIPSTMAASGHLYTYDYLQSAYFPKDIHGSAVYGAVWNDYAEYRQTVKNIKPGMVVIEQGDGSMQPSTNRLQPGGNIVSDTFGFAIGETDNCKTPLAVSGRALAYPAEDRYSYEPGDAVGTGPNGTVSKMTREEIMMYPERIIGTVSEIPEYERWGTGNVLVDGRIWIKVK